jgi:hypothetical protein
VSEALSLIEELGSITKGDPLARANHVVDAARVCAAAGDLALGQRLLEDADAVMARQRHSVVTARAILAEAGGMLGEAAALYDGAATADGLRARARARPGAARSRPLPASLGRRMPTFRSPPRARSSPSSVPTR